MEKGTMKLLSIVVILACFSACKDYSDNEVTVEETYTREFVKQFGLIDPNQDWNMACSITANIDLNSLPKAARVNVYTAKPGIEGCRLVASRSTSESTFQFDYLKGSMEAYVTVCDASGLVLDDGYVNIEDNAINVSGGENKSLVWGFLCNVGRNL